MKFADLHLHTHWSDGFFTPRELLAEAAKRGFSSIAITDHDTVCGSDEADLLAAEYNIEIISSVEITTWAGLQEFHILGYLVDKTNKNLLANLEFNRNQRLKRMKRMLEKLNGMGLKLDFEEFKEFYGKAVVGRLHLAHFLSKKKVVASPHEAFEKYIGSKSPGYEKGEYISTAEAIKSIKEAGGVAVWAHPGLGSVEGKFSSLLKWGLRGLEIYYPKHSDDQISNFNYLAWKYGLLVTGGSDCHGQWKGKIQMGEIKLPYARVERLKEAVSQVEIKAVGA